jgi:hypothetical protein
MLYNAIKLKCLIGYKVYLYIFYVCVFRNFLVLLFNLPYKVLKLLEFLILPMIFLEKNPYSIFKYRLNGFINESNYPLQQCIYYTKYGIVFNGLDGKNQVYLLLAKKYYDKMFYIKNINSFNTHHRCIKWDDKF